MSEGSGRARAGRPKSEEKANAILQAAGELVLNQGYQGTSMDAVAQHAGVSKQTVYSHFANKEELFAACIRAKVTGYGFDGTAVAPEGDLHDVLLGVVRRFTDLLFDPDVVAMHRLVACQAKNHPRVAKLFFESGPLRTKRSVAALLREQARRARLCIDEDRLTYATTQLLNMAVGKYQLELITGQRKRVPKDELAEHLERTVEDFLRLYGAQ